MGSILERQHLGVCSERGHETPPAPPCTQAPSLSQTRSGLLTQTVLTVNSDWKSGMLHAHPSKICV